MKEEAATSGDVEDIQTKLFTKVLPILEKHMMDTTDSAEEPPTIRSFVVMSIAKTIRKLPFH